MRSLAWIGLSLSGGSASPLGAAGATVTGAAGLGVATVSDIDGGRCSLVIGLPSASAAALRST